MTVRKETVAEFLARGGRIQIITLPEPVEVVSAPETVHVPIPSCPCCGRVKGHRHWCLYNEHAPVPPTVPAQPRDGHCLKCARALRSKSKKICVTCALTGLCVFCGNPFTPASRFGRFICPSCK